MTQLTKAVGGTRESAWLTVGVPWVAGYVVQASDVAPARTPEALFAELGLGFPSSPFAADAPFVDVIQLPPSPELLLTSPAEGDGQPVLLDHEPFRSGSGFVDSAAGFVPVWWVAPSRLPAGSSLWRISSDGTSRMIAGYASVAEGWIAAPGVEIPATPLRDAQVLGMRATWEGRELLADVLPDGRTIVCAPEEFAGAEHSARGVWWREVPPAELQNVVVLRVLATWQTLPVQLVAMEQKTAEGAAAHIVYVGRDMLAAEAAGMAKTDAGVYESVVPATELDDVREERRAVEVAPSPKTSADGLTARQQELADFGRSVLAPRFPDAELKTVPLPDDDAVYVYPNVRGGGILIVAADKTALFAASSIQVDDAIAEFRKGRRSVIRPVTGDAR